MACTSFLCVAYITPCASNAQNNIHVDIQPIMYLSVGKIVCPQNPVITYLLACLTCIKWARTRQPHSGVTGDGECRATCPAASDTGYNEPTDHGMPERSTM